MTVQQDRDVRPLLRVIGVAGALAGLLAIVPGLPAALAVVLLGLFVLLGPGAAVLVNIPPMSVPLMAAAGPAIGISVVILAATLSVNLHAWSPNTLTAILCLASLAALGASAVLARSGAGAVVSRQHS